MLRVYTTLGILCVALLASGCFWDFGPSREPLEPAEIPGTYEANWHAGLSERLWLSADSTYHYEFVDSNDGLHSNSGRYEVTVHMEDESVERVTVWLRMFRRFNAMHSRYCYMPRLDQVVDSIPCMLGLDAGVLSRTGEKALVQCGDRGQYYVKVQDSVPK